MGEGESEKQEAREISLEGNSNIIQFGGMTYAHKDVRITGHKDVYFYIFEIGKLNPLGPKSAF